MRFRAYDAHRIQQADIALVVIGGVGVELQAVVLDGDLGERRRFRLAEHTREEVEIVLHVVVLVVLQEVDVIGIFPLHALAAVGIITLVAAGGADEIERTVVGAVGAALIAGHVPVVAAGYFFAVGDGRENRCDAVGIDRTDDLVGVVVAL